MGNAKPRIFRAEGLTRVSQATSTLCTLNDKGSRKQALVANVQCSTIVGEHRGAGGYDKPLPQALKRGISPPPSETLGVKTTSSIKFWLFSAQNSKFFFAILS